MSRGNSLFILNDQVNRSSTQRRCSFRFNRVTALPIYSRGSYATSTRIFLSRLLRKKRVCHHAILAAYLEQLSEKHLRNLLRVYASPKGADGWKFLGIALRALPIL